MDNHTSHLSIKAINIVRVLAFLPHCIHNCNSKTYDYMELLKSFIPIVSYPSLSISIYNAVDLLYQSIIKDTHISDLIKQLREVGLTFCYDDGNDIMSVQKDNKNIEGSEFDDREQLMPRQNKSNKSYAIVKVFISQKRY